MCVSPELGSQARQARLEPGFSGYPHPLLMGSLHFPLCFDCLGAPNLTLSLVTRWSFFSSFFAETFNFNLFCCCCSILKGPGAHLRLQAFEGGSRLDWSRLPLGLWAHGVSNMAAAAGEGNAVQELHCEHKAKAEGGRAET